MMLVVKGVSFVSLLGLSLSLIGCGSNSPSAKLQSAPEKVRIKGRYIVKMKDSNSVERLIRAESNLDVRHKFEHALNGFSAELSEDQLENLLKSDEVESISEVARYRLSETQPNAPWGIDRIDQESGTLDKKYNYNFTGSGVNAYIIDSGINVKHKDFEGRAINGTDVTVDKGTKLEGVDGHGHGSHVAGTVGSATYGVAKKVNLIAVKVFDSTRGEASHETVIAGIDFSIGDHKAKKGPSVANLSLVGSASEVLDKAINAAIEAGINVVVAAGNDNSDACKYSPARVTGAITVAAMDQGDRKASYSNHGACVDVIAPGSRIKSTWKGSDTATNTIDGTSMASPHVAGVVALYLEKNQKATVTEIHDFIISSSLSGKVRGFSSTTPNRLLSTQWGL